MSSYRASLKRKSLDGSRYLLRDQAAPGFSANPYTSTSVDIDDAIPLSDLPQYSSRTQTHKMDYDGHEYGAGADEAPLTQWTAEKGAGNTSNSGGGMAGMFRRGQRRAVSNSTNALGSKRLTSVGQFYKKIYDFSIITRYLLFWAPPAIIFAIPIIVGAVPNQGAEIGGVRIIYFFAWVEIVWAALWISKLVAKVLPFVFVFLSGVVSAGTRKYKVVLEALEFWVGLCLWALTSLATFTPIMTLKTTQQDWMTIVNEVLGAILVSFIIVLVEKLFVQLISISYHRKSYEAKIRSSKRDIRFLTMLYEASRSLFPNFCAEFSEEDYLINYSLAVPGSRGSKLLMRGMHDRSGAATPMRILQDVGRLGDKVTAAFGNIASEITGKQMLNPTSGHSVVVAALEKQTASEALAKRIWMSLVVEGKDALFKEDVVEVLGLEHRDEAADVFTMLDEDKNGDVSLDEMILVVEQIGKDRKSIARSLHDVDQAINVLDNLLCTILVPVIAFIFVAFLNRSLVTTVATAGTTLLSLSFIFSVSAQEILGSCIFLFVKHPFDIGDQVNINSIYYTVEHISLLYTIFKRLDGGRLSQCPNIVLNTIWIDNISRSGAMYERLVQYISFDTSLEDIRLLKDQMQAFVLDPDNSRDFQPDIEVEVTGISDMGKMELTIGIRHKSNWSNETVRAARRSKFMCALVLALRKVPIYGPGGGGADLGSANQPSYTVAVSDKEAAAARDAFEKAKQAGRLVNAKPETDQADPSTADSTANATESDMSRVATGGKISSTTSMQRKGTVKLGSQAEHAAMSLLNDRSPSLRHRSWFNRGGAGDASPMPPIPQGVSLYDAPYTTSSGAPQLPLDPALRQSSTSDEFAMLHRANTLGKRRETYASSLMRDSSHQSDDEYRTSQAEPNTPRGYAPNKNLHTIEEPSTGYEYSNPDYASRSRANTAGQETQTRGNGYSPILSTNEMQYQPYTPAWAQNSQYNGATSRYDPKVPAPAPLRASPARKAVGTGSSQDAADAYRSPSGTQAFDTSNVRLASPPPAHTPSGGLSIPSAAYSFAPPPANTPASQDAPSSMATSGQGTSPRHASPPKSNAAELPTSTSGPSSATEALPPSALNDLPPNSPTSPTDATYGYIATRTGSSNTSASSRKTSKAGQVLGWTSERSPPLPQFPGSPPPQPMSAATRLKGKAAAEEHPGNRVSLSQFK